MRLVLELVGGLLGFAVRRVDGARVDLVYNTGTFID
jgi:hypothetical protein